MGSTDTPITFLRKQQAWVGLFKLMASECEIHIRTSEASFAHKTITQAYREAKRIEQHFSRYISGNALHTINNSPNTPITLDTEYCELLNYALTLYDISDGMFDISCGALRHLWRFNTAEQQPPTQAQLDAALSNIGLNKIHWSAPQLTLPQGTELDFGGIGKEYAVDKAAQVIQGVFDGEYLVNFGGDCYCKGSAESPWTIAVESISSPADVTNNTVTLLEGGVATSGTTKRFFTSGGKRFGHILNPKTARPIEHAPLSVTVVHQSCLSAGALATLAMLEGKAAEQYLQDQELIHWVLR